MAERAETLNVDITDELELLVPVETSPQPLKHDTVTEIKRAAGEKYEDAKTWAVETYARVAEKSEVLADRARHNFEVMRDERPLLIVGLVAGTAFVLGVVLRVWRSQYDV